MTAPFTDAENQERHGAVFMAGMDVFEVIHLLRWNFERTGGLYVGCPEGPVAPRLGDFLGWVVEDGAEGIHDRLTHARKQVCRWMTCIEWFRAEIDTEATRSFNAQLDSPAVFGLCDAFLERREGVAS